jgi:D-sedoheptulose 7-phosphate isomerase
MTHIHQYLDDATAILQGLDRGSIEQTIRVLQDVRARRGRLFFLGVGGSAGNCSHAVNDFRKIGGFEAYTPVDNVCELTARANDEGWNTVFVEWLRGSRLTSDDAVFVLSVGGGDRENNISVNIVTALEYAVSCGAAVLGIVGRDGGYTLKVADACVVVPTANRLTVTPHSEAFQAVVWHLIVSDPRIMQAPMKWESTIAQAV